MAASTFSYAQAAKGQSAAPSNTTTPAEQAQDSQAPAVAAKPATSEADQATIPDVLEAADTGDARPAIPEKQDVDSIPGSESDARSESVQERRSDSRRDDDAGKLDRPWRRNDKATRSSSAATRSTDDQDTRKARRGKKGKTSEKQTSDQAEKEQEAEPEPKVELSEAPIPSVNIWHQRKEAHLAKGKSPTTNASEPAVNGSSAGQLEESKPLAKSTEDSTVTGTRDVPYMNGVKAQRKVTDPTRPERNGPRGARLADKDGRDGKTGVPPPVEDATSWPTPETAIKEIAVKEEKRKTSDNRSETNSQEDGSQSKSRQKKKDWVTYDYVPTVNFETQLPQMRNSKPRGGARAGRDSGARMTAGGIPDKAAAAAPLNKANGSVDRSRDTNGSHRATSLPPAAKRASLDGTNSREQKKPAGQAGSDKGKDGAAQSFESGQASRPEGRGDRGRGGYRGRGGHHAVNSQTQHQHSASAIGPQGFGVTGPAASRAQGPYSPPLRQGSHGQVFMPPTQRGRGGRNGASNFHRMSLPNGTSRIPAVQTQFPGYDYTMAPMTAIPFQQPPYWDNMLMTLLKGQIEYYFSIENLCKDMYLRGRMDSQGFVPLHFISAFKRMRDLTQDLSLIRIVCEESTEIDFVVGEDDCERLRRREDWQKFVLPMKDRDELARNDGPAQLTYKNRNYPYNHHYNGIPPMGYAPAYPTGPNDAPFQHYPDVNHVDHGINGVVNGNGASQLSADVPDFSPSGSAPLDGLEVENLNLTGYPSKSLNPEASVVAPGLTNGHVDAPLTNGLTNGVHAEEHATAQS
ncbi:Fc.00g069380.m01.CDS01 [Cosmosporella sp. VM-42]